MVVFEIYLKEKFKLKLMGICPNAINRYLKIMLTPVLALDLISP